MRSHIWKIFQFSGWFVLLVGLIFGMLYASINIGIELYGAMFLIVLGAIMIVIGEFLLTERESKYSIIWNAFSMSGAFSLTVGIIWVAIQFLETYESWFGIAVVVAVGLALIILGESIKLEKK